MNTREKKEKNINNRYNQSFSVVSDHYYCSQLCSRAYVPHCHCCGNANHFFLDGIVSHHIFPIPEKRRIYQDSCTSYFITKNYGTIHDVDHTLCVENKQVSPFHQISRSEDRPFVGLEQVIYVLKSLVVSGQVLEMVFKRSYLLLELSANLQSLTSAASQ